MKAYPENLARLVALQEAAEWLYGRAEESLDEAEWYRLQIDEAKKEGGEKAAQPYHVECMTKAEAKAAAYRELADNMTGRVV